MDSSPSKINTPPSLPSTAGVKRPAPSLLPAFEPFSSSPGFPRPSKRQARSSPSQREHAYQKYPTPIPTSTTGILSSSPPQVHARPGLHRTQSSISERAPLSAVPSITLPENGEILKMGRSSNSSHYQLSANRLISRVHVEARYIAASVPLEPNKVEIKCKGWNGVKLHCQGRTWELAKDDTFTSETEFAEIMLDVQDARVRIAWPDRERKESIGSWDDETSPRGRLSAVNARGQIIESSPLRRGQRIESPVSPTPAGNQSSGSLADLFSDDAEPSIVKVYEDQPSPEEESRDVADSFVSTQAATSFAQPVESQSSDLSEPEDDPDEENDPIVHSFGPYGANISSRMASFTTIASPELPRRDPTPSPKARSSSESTNDADAVPVVNHVVNQLAFSRLSSTPLSVIMNNLPAELRNPSPKGQENKGLTKDDLRKLINAASCIGEIHREGKDAAGKALESEYYYIPDGDRDEQRRAAVVDGLRKPSLRNCRKQHKVYRSPSSTIYHDTNILTLTSNTTGNVLEPPDERNVKRIWSPL
ncbi:hypothetical protein EG329_013851 [Mollisiaceae sp. DMI_Dod_QoI]|nr:hypothetical protein EG329_013851 [Helotiales sp. DMI_Dod_QoI]